MTACAGALFREHLSDRVDRARDVTPTRPWIDRHRSLDEKNF